MAAKLDIEYIEIRNFLSYGDYVTRLEVANLGPVLILGEVELDEEIGSNGAGKSSLLTAFIWCLFGRTITNPNPGDRIVNWFNKKNCYVKIKTADGWEIIRTRNVDGHSELILRKDGDDETQSTNTNAQTKLTELFGLDYEIFTSSVFCGQFGKSFLEMAPIKRKETIERLLGLDRLNSFADEAKLQFQQVETKQEVTRAKVEVLQADVKRQEERLENAVEQKGLFEENRGFKLAKLKERLEEIQEKVKTIDLPDVSKIKQQWEVAYAILEKVSEYQDQIKENEVKIGLYREELENISLTEPDLYEIPNLEELEQEHQKVDEALIKIKEVTKALLKVQGQIHCSERDAMNLEEQIHSWEHKADTQCESCGQDIGPDHVNKSIESLKEELDRMLKLRESHRDTYERLNKGKTNLESIERPRMSIDEAKRLEEFNRNIRESFEKAIARRSTLQVSKTQLEASNIKLEKLVQATMNKLEQIKPTITMDEISQLQTAYDACLQREADLEEQIENVISESNPWTQIYNDLIKASDSLQEEIDEYQNEIEQLDTLFQHYKYIYRSYSDRRKIKSWLLSELIPFLNDRVQYYLDMLDINFTIKFGSTLNAETDRWDYEFCSGGERKRIDLAIMFGLYDLYMSIYGQQCNIMVLDEVDSRLDKKGVEAFSEIINDICTNDERPRPSTVFVISHKQELQSLFPSQVIIKKTGNYSGIDQTVFTSD